MVFMPHTPPRVPLEVARVRVPCGELLLTQAFTRTTDPYVVWLYFRPSGGKEWTQYFVDDEAPYWWGGLVPEGDGATLTFYGRARGRFGCSDRTFRLLNRVMPELRSVTDPFDVRQVQRRPL